MSYVSGTGLISGSSGGSSSQNNVVITIDHEAVLKNTDDITSLSSIIDNLTTNDIPEGSGSEINNLYYTDERVDANIALKSTDDIAEGTKLYYTEERVNANIALKSTDDIAEGTKLYYTEERVNANIVLKSTDDIAEGTKLYYTEERVNANIALKSTTDISEGDNLYYTEDRVNANIALKSTTDISEGDNLYYTEDRVNANIALKSTDDITEGDNLYYTEDRVNANIALKSTDDITEGDNLYYTEERVNNNTELLTIKNQINGYTDLEGNDIYGILQVIYGYPIGGDKTSETYTNGILDYITNLQKSVDGYVDSEGNVVLGVLQVIHGHPLGDSENENYVKGILDILKDLEDKDTSQDQTAIASMVAQGAYELGKWAQGKVKNSGLFGAKLTNSYSPLTNSSPYNTLTGDTMEELLGELNNFVDVYRYDAINSEAGINHDPITGYKLMVGGKTKIKGDLEFLKKGSTTVFYSLQDLIFIKSLDVNTLSIDSNNKLSVKIKPDLGISSDANGLYVNYEVASLEIDTSTKKLKVKDNFSIQDGKNGIERITTSTDKDKLQLKLKTNNSGLIADTNGLYINTDINTLEIDSVSDKLKVKIKPDSGITSDTTGLKVDYDTSSLTMGTNKKLQVVPNKYQSKFASIPVVNAPPVSLASSLTFNNATNQFIFTPQKNQLAEASSAGASAGSTAGASAGTAAATAYLTSQAGPLGVAAASAGAAAGSAAALLLIKGEDGSDGEDGKGWKGVEMILGEDDEFNPYYGCLVFDSDHSELRYTTPRLMQYSERNTYGNGDVQTYLNTNNYITSSALNTYATTSYVNGNFNKYDDTNVNNLLSTKGYITDLSAYATTEYVNGNFNKYDDTNVNTYLTDNNYITSSALDDIDLSEYVHKSSIFVEAVGNQYELQQNMSFNPTAINWIGNDRNGVIADETPIFYKNDKVQLYNMSYVYDQQGNLAKQFLILPDRSLQEISLTMQSGNTYITLTQVGSYGRTQKYNVDDSYQIFSVENTFIVQDTALYTDEILPILTYGDANVNSLLETKNYITEHQDLSLYALKTELNTYGNIEVQQYLNDNDYITTTNLDLSSYYNKTEVDSLINNLEIPSALPEDILISNPQSLSFEVNGNNVYGTQRDFITDSVITIPTTYIMNYDYYYYNLPQDRITKNIVYAYEGDTITVVDNLDFLSIHSQTIHTYSYLTLVYLNKDENVSFDILTRDANIATGLSGKVGNYEIISVRGYPNDVYYEQYGQVKTVITFTLPSSIDPNYEFRFGLGFITDIDGVYSDYKMCRIETRPNTKLNSNYIVDLPIANIQFPNNTGFLKITDGILSYDATGGGGSSSEQVDLSPYALISSLSDYALISSLNNYTLQTTFNTLETTMINDYVLKTTLNDYLLTTDILENSKIKTEIMPPYISSFNDITGSLSQYITDTFSFLQYGDIQAGNNISFTTPIGGGITINAVNTNTDTTYTAGTGITITGTTINCDVINTDTTYTSGTGITINGTTINCDVINTDTIYTAGNGININNTEISIDPSFSSGSGSEYTQKPTILGTFSLEENLNNVSGGVRDIHYFDERIFITDDDGYHSIIELALKYVSGSYVDQTFDLYVGEVITVSFLLVDTNYYNFIQNIDLQVGTYQIILKVSSVELWYNGNMINYSSETIPSEGFINDIDPHNINYIQGKVKCIIRYKKLYKTPQIYYNDVPFITDIYQGLVSNNMLGLWASRLYLGGPTDIGQFIQTKSVEGGTGYEWSKFLNYENLTPPSTNGYLKYDGTNWIIDANGGSGGITPFIPVNAPPPNTLSYRRTSTEQEVYETTQYVVFDEEVEFNNALRLERVNATVWQNLSIYNSTDKTQANLKDQADIFLCNDIYQLVFDRMVLPANLETYGTLFRINYQYKLHILNSLIKSYVDFECPKIIFPDGSFIDSANNLGGGGGGGVSYPLSGDGIFSTGQDYKSTDGINRLKFLDNSATYIQANNVIGNRILGIDKLSINETNITTHTPLFIGTGTYLKFPDGTTMTTKPTFSDINPVNNWLSTSDGMQRYYYGSNGDSYYKTGDTHRFRNSSDKDLIQIIGDSVNTELRISSSESGDAKILLGTPNSSSISNKHNCAIIADGRYSWSRADLCLCVANAKTNSSVSDATTANTRIRIKYDSYTDITGAGYLSGWTRLIRYQENYIHHQAWRQNYNIVLRIGGEFWAGAYFISSDSRIKKDIVELEDEECLQKILKLKPCKYRYIDETKNKSENKVYGFIAQEVKEVFPEAVSIQKECLPNIMRKASITDKNKICMLEQLVELNETINLQVNMEITIYDNDENKIACKIIEIYDENNFKIDKDISGDLCFIYGSMVDDFNTINKEYINCVNISAVQELHKKIVSQQEKINYLEEKLNMIMSHLNISI